MKNTDQTLTEQMRITDFEVVSRKELFSITTDDVNLLMKAKPLVESGMDTLVDAFYKLQTAVPEIAVVIGDADTLVRLRSAQRVYILDLFSGYYDIEYVNNRLRIGLVHKRIGVEPKLYLAAIQTLKQLINELIKEIYPEPDVYTPIILAIDKLIMFDISLVFDTYIRSLVSEIELSREKSEQYASALEEKVQDRTEQLEKLSRTDALTGLLNRHYFDELLVQILRASLRRNEPFTVAYIDINDFKIINDTQGHRRGDEILQNVAKALKTASRPEDLCFRYGGDEFFVILQNCKKDGASKEWGKRVVKFLDKYEGSPKLSMGYVQTGPDQYASAEELIQQADEEMYAEKKRMKNAEKK